MIEIRVNTNRTLSACRHPLTHDGHYTFKILKQGTHTHTL